MIRRTMLLVALTLGVTLLWAADLSGTWDGAVETSLGSGSPNFVFKQEGEKLTGDYSGALGAAPLTGTVKGDAVEFTFKIEANGESIQVEYKGKLAADGKKIAGTVKLGSLGDGNFTATRR